MGKSSVGDWEGRGNCHNCVRLKKLLWERMFMGAVRMYGGGGGWVVVG